MSEFSQSDINDTNNAVRERRLRELAIAAQTAPPQSVQRQLAIERLIGEIWRSPKLGHPQKGFWSASFYTDIYHEALQKTLLEVCQKIELYNPQYPVMAWVNFRLNKQFINAIDEYRKKGITNIPKKRQKTAICVPNLANLEEHLAGDCITKEEEMLAQFIERDPENLMSAEFLT